MVHPAVSLARILPLQLIIRPDERVELDGLRVTSVARTVADLILSVDRFSAVSVLDSALFQGLLAEGELDQVHSAIAARGCLGQFDGRAESLRFTWQDTLDPDTIPRAVRRALPPKPAPPCPWQQVITGLRG